MTTESSALVIRPREYRTVLPRVSKTVMRDLRIWMMTFGLLIGLVFPFALIILGVPRDIVLRPGFFAATVAAGLVVGLVNQLLVQVVVGVRLRALADGMQRVEHTLVDRTQSGDWQSCDPISCMVPVDSADELGEVAASFNALVAGLATSHQVNDGVSAMGQALAAHLDLSALADSTLRELTSRTGGAAAGLFVVGNGRVELAGSQGLIASDEISASEVIRTTVRTQEPTVLHLPSDLVVSGAVVDFVPQEVQILPVKYGVLLVGVLLIAFTERTSPEAQAVIQGTLPGLAVALHNALSHQDLERVAALDPLTGAFNRRFGLQRLQEEVGRSTRSGDPLGLLMLDLDHFKAINDTYGHVVGDRVLKMVVAAVRTVLRDGDVLTRYGGEEFVVLLPGAGRADLLEMAERVRHSVAEADMSEGSQRIPVTVSIGAAGLPNAAVTDPDSLIALADSALYLAKDAGRNRTVLA